MLAGVWLRTSETEISAEVWEMAECMRLRWCAIQNYKSTLTLTFGTAATTGKSSTLTG